MAKVRKEDKLPLRLKQLGKIYRLVEQFEEISRIDLSKLSQLAPATITALTRELIEERLIIERAVQNTESRGRPAVGLCVSPFYWQALCAILAEDHFDILLCELDGTPISQQTYPLTPTDLTDLESVLICHLLHFLNQVQRQLNHPITFSIAVTGELDKTDNRLCRLGKTEMNLDLQALFAPHFNIPIIVTEYFQTWLLAENTLGSVIGCDNVLFVQLGDVINLSAVSQGEILCRNGHSRITIDKMIVPKLSPVQEAINPDLPEIERYQVMNQITHKAVYRLIDHFYPQNNLADNAEKIYFLCRKVKEGEAQAVEILNHLADVTAYILMNLVNVFCSKKIMLSSGLPEEVKDVFLPRINETLNNYLAPNGQTADVITSQYEWNSPVVVMAAIKQGIYDGSLLGHLIKDVQ
ncbi:ROK family protein [Caviibacterium pharyngocola]|uniref:ROK family protein n=1 Tax=Caviibacterium pharyngocola TaxID=28159 RepID=A0A2M8RUW9_9PAST|nr:ROK family protein [Caviibacterium pharyngocola]PJG82690.1 ROK family protein [Caviibacterium pharyngocola]